MAAVRDGDESAFGALVEPYRRQLRVHCYRMLGSFDDAEDLVQETLLRAWRGRAGFEGRSLVRTWLYRIATNACLNALERAPRRVLPSDVGPATADPGPDPNWAPELPWLTPFPDAMFEQTRPPPAALFEPTGPPPATLFEPTAPSNAEPDAQVISRETIELAYLAAIQHLPPRQRAILLLRDALDWSAKEVASLLETTVPSVNSALQRARATMRSRLPAGRLDWAPATAPSEQELAVLRQFMDAYERADAAALTALLREDARQTMPPALVWLDGRDAVARLFAWVCGPESPGDFRMVPTAANGQPAAAIYIRKHGESVYQLMGLQVLRIEGGQIAEITSFHPEHFAAFDLPPTALSGISRGIDR
jgi:RNA polymerase sigma-70 factor (ECF subfamily)